MSPFLIGVILDCWVSWLISLLERAIPTFLGVLLAFGLARWWEKRSEGKQKENLKVQFRSEIVTCIDNLRAMKGQFAPTAVWEAATGAGMLRLLSPEQAIQLSRAYAAIGNYNYESTNSRRLAERVRVEANISVRRPIEEELDRVVKERNNLAKSCLRTIRALTWLIDPQTVPVIQDPQ
jgi:hypothetical protein